MKNKIYICNNKQLKLKKMRRQLLNVSLNTERNLEAVISDIEKKDLKFLDRKIMALENELDDAEEELEKRLSIQQVIDESVVESMFGKMIEIETKRQQYEAFRDYYQNEGEECDFRLDGGESMKEDTFGK